MDRERLEGTLDKLFSDRLTDHSFLENCVGSLRERSQQNGTALKVQRLTAEIEALQRKRNRVIDSFVEGTIGRADRDQRLSVIDEGIRAAKDSLGRQSLDTTLDTSGLIEAFTPLAEWQYWTREQKRTVLAALVPDIRVADYHIESLGLNPAMFIHEITRRGRGSWPLPA
jgi:hypothetical protein